MQFLQENFFFFKLKAIYVGLSVHIKWSYFLQSPQSIILLSFLLLQKIHESFKVNTLFVPYSSFSKSILSVKSLFDSCRTLTAWTKIEWSLVLKQSDLEAILYPWYHLISNLTGNSDWQSWTILKNSDQSWAIQTTDSFWTIST